MRRHALRSIIDTTEATQGAFIARDAHSSNPQNMMLRQSTNRLPYQRNRLPLAHSHLHMPPSPPPLRARSRIIAVALLLAYGLALPGVSPASAFLAAWFHEGHQVEVEIDHGHLDVILHHHHDATDHANEHSAHEHGIGSEEDAHHDHVIHCASLDQASGRMLPLAIASPVSLHGEWIAWQQLSLPKPITVRFAPLHARPPPASLAMLCLRTTVLVV